MRFPINRVTAAVLPTMMLALVGCQDGNDGAPGKDGEIVSPGAETLTLAITKSEVVDGRLAIEFDATNELALPVIRINELKVQAAQLLPQADGERSQWQVLSYEKCTESKGCAGELTETESGHYRYLFDAPLDEVYDASLPQRTLLTVYGNDRYPEAEVHSDYMVDGSELSHSRNIVAADSCLQCHDSIAEIKHGGGDLANCASCHTDNNMSNADKVWPVLAHQVHVGVSSRNVGNCTTCHASEVSDELTQGLNWMATPNRQTCESCHDMASNAIYDHKGQQSNANCLECHSADDTKAKHLASYDKAKAEDQRNIVTVDVVNAKLVSGATLQPDMLTGSYVADAQYALIDFALRDREGNAIVLDEYNPGTDAIWIKNLQMYVNWGASVDFTNSRGYSIFTKSNKKYGNSTDGGYTPDGERPRTKPYLNGAMTQDAIVNDGVLTYAMGPIVTQDAISGDLINDSGFITNRLIYCFDPAQNLVDCDSAGHAKNAADNQRWYFTKDGLTTEPTQQRPLIVSNAKCGSCHGYDELTMDTELSCRNCHSRNTEINKELANTTCFSGHDHDETKAPHEEGYHILPREERAMNPRGLSGFISSTADIVDPCLACHNPNTPPTQAIREMHTKAGDKYFVEELTVSHPDHKVWMHSLHTNQRATQNYANGVRNIDFPADKANCTRCHEGDSFGVDRLTAVGRPLALDLDYNPDSRAHPATDITVDAYVSPVSATCYACHAKKTDDQGNKVIDPAVRAHMEQNGGRFGVELDELEVESCAVCHSVDNLKEVHGL